MYYLYEYLQIGHVQHIFLRLKKSLKRVYATRLGQVHRTNRKYSSYLISKSTLFPQWNKLSKTIIISSPTMYQ